MVAKINSQEREVIGRILSVTRSRSQIILELWSPLKKNGYIGIVGYFDTAKQENTKESGKKNE